MEIGIAGGTQQPIFESFSIQMPKTIGFEFGHPPAKPHIDDFRKAVKEHLAFLFIKPSTSISFSRVTESFQLFWNFAIQKHQLYLFERSRVPKTFP